MKNKNTVQFVGFTEAIKRFFVKYSDCDGTATRAEYWWVQLFIQLSLVCIGIMLLVGHMISHYLGIMVAVMAFIFFIAMIVPSIMLSIRRMHDIGLSGWWFFCINIPASILARISSTADSINNGGFGALSTFSFCLFLISLVLLCQPSVLENNKYREIKS